MSRKQGKRGWVAAACLAIILVGAFLRLAGTDWDTGSNLHPDERHMMFVLTDSLTALGKPEAARLSWSEVWFDAGVSPLDPRRNGQLYVYGELPHLVTAVAGLLTDSTGWPQLLRLGRTLGAIVDSYTILAVFLLGATLFGSARAALIGAAFYALLPIALQQADFFAVDSWLTGMGAWCALFATLLLRAPGGRAALGYAALSGLFAGLAFACKLPGGLFCGVIAAALVVRLVRERRIAVFIGGALTSALAMGIAFRLGAPFTFEGPGLFGLRPTQAVIDGYVSMSKLVLDFGFPPNWQWMTGSNSLNALGDLLVWGLGPIVSVALFAGIGSLLWQTRDRWAALVPLAASVAVFFFYWLWNPVPAMRYVIPATPGLTVLAAGAFVLLPAWTSAGAALLALIWGLGVPILHTNPNSRVAASQWLWANISAGTVIAGESAWDDSLPIAIRLVGQDGLLYPDQNGHFRSVRLNLEYPDSADKARGIAEGLAQADVLAMSSERMRKPILALSNRFPMSAAYYRLLAAGELCYGVIYEDRSAYPLLGLRLDDTGAQEPWTVYDHPSVTIYKKLPCFNQTDVEAKLIAALPAPQQ
jgi:hypothetical protein